MKAYLGGGGVIAGTAYRQQINGPLTSRCTHRFYTLERKLVHDFATDKFTSFYLPSLAF